MLPTGAGIRIKSTNGTSTFSTYGSEMSWQLTINYWHKLLLLQIQKH
jgi:hypothetical protein